MKYYIYPKEFLKDLKDKQEKRFIELVAKFSEKGLSLVVGKGATQVSTNVTGPNGQNMITKQMYIITISAGLKSIAQKQELRDEAIKINDFLAEFLGEYVITTDIK